MVGEDRSERYSEGYRRVVEHVRNVVKDLARIAADIDPENFERVLDRMVLSFMKVFFDVYVEAMKSMKAAKAEE